MNNIVNIGGYRLFQSSYDRDGRGSTLIVNYDPIGYKLSLVGYLLLFIGSVTIFISPNSRFNRLRKQIAKPIVVALFLFGFSGNICSAGLKREEIQKYTPEISLSQKFGDLNVQSFSGRNESVSSYAGKILNKISNKNIYDGLLPEQALLGIIIYPEFWNNQPIIFSENKTIKSLTGESGDYHSFKSCFDKAGNYKLRASIDGIYEKDLTQRTKYDREILKVDEKLNIILSLQQWLLLPILPLKNDTNERWLTFRDNLSLFPEEDYTIIKEITSEYPEALIDLTNRRNTEKASLIIEQISLLQTKNASAGVIDKKKNQIERVYHRINIFARLYVPFMALGTVMIICSVSLLFRNRRWLSTICNIAFCITMLLYLLLTAGIAVRWYLSGPEERRVGKECRLACNSRCASFH